VRNSARRGYSSGHGHGPEASSDLPWAAGAVAVTVPACWYLLKSSPEEAHHLHVPHKIEAHGKPEAEAEEEEAKEVEPKAEEPKEEEPKAEEEPSATGNEEKEKSVDASKPDSESNDSDKDTAEDSGSNDETTATDAKHSTDVGEDSSVSQKAEGTPESSKSKDTVDVGKPAK